MGKLEKCGRRENVGHMPRIFKAYAEDFPFFLVICFGFDQSYDRVTRMFLKSVWLYTSPLAYDAVHLQNLDSDYFKDSFIEIQYFYVQSIIEIPQEVDDRFLGKAYSDYFV